MLAHDDGDEAAEYADPPGRPGRQAHGQEPTGQQGRMIGQGRANRPPGQTEAHSLPAYGGQQRDQEEENSGPAEDEQAYHRGWQQRQHHLVHDGGVLFGGILEGGGQYRLHDADSTVWVSADRADCEALAA